ncbi:MAG: acyl-CoA thioesterase [Bacillaceae bacterium]
MFISKKEIEVRYAETDQMGVVYHGNYIPWMELGRIQFMKDLGLSYVEMENEGVLSPVLNINVDYKKPAKYGDEITVYTSLKEYNGFKVVYAYEIRNQDNELCTIATSSHVCVDKQTFKPIIFKRNFPQWHQLYVQAMKKDF